MYLEGLFYRGHGWVGSPPLQQDHRLDRVTLHHIVIQSWRIAAGTETNDNGAYPRWDDALAFASRPVLRDSRQDFREGTRQVVGKHELEGEEWTHKRYKHTNQVEDMLQAVLAHHFLVRYRLAEREIAQSEQFDIRIVGVISLQKSMVSSCGRKAPIRQAKRHRLSRAWRS